MKDNKCKTYKFRAECAADAQAIRSLLLPWSVDWKESRENMEHEGSIYQMPDVEVEFSIVDGGPTLNEIQWLIDGIDDCHVASETVEEIESYTGERVSRRAFAAPAKQPSEGLMKKAQATAILRQRVLKNELQRAQHLHMTFEAIRISGNTKSAGLEGPNPGWIAVVEHKPTGLSSVRRVTARGFGKNMKKMEHVRVDARMTTIDS